MSAHSGHRSNDILSPMVAPRHANMKPGPTLQRVNVFSANQDVVSAAKDVAIVLIVPAQSGR